MKQDGGGGQKLYRARRRAALTGDRRHLPWRVLRRSWGSTHPIPVHVIVGQVDGLVCSTRGMEATDA